MRHHTVGLIAGSVLCLTVAVSCASASDGRSGPARDWDVLTTEEVEASNQTDAYGLIRTQRPNWLRRRGRQSVNLTSEIVVYMDATRLGGVASLRTIPINMVMRAEYLDATTATQRFGTGHGMGAIVVFSR